MNDNHHTETPEQRFKRLSKALQEKSKRDADLAALVSESSDKTADKLQAVRVLRKADKERFSSALSTLMKRD